MLGPVTTRSSPGRVIEPMPPPLAAPLGPAPPGDCADAANGSVNAATNHSHLYLRDAFMDFRYCAGTITSRSSPDSAPHASPARPSICRTFACSLFDAKVSNFSVTGSNLTMALMLQSVSHTLSWLSTQTEYVCALPGNFHSRHARVAASYIPTWPVLQ